MNEMKGYQIEMLYLEYSHSEKIKHVKQKCQFMITALEAALYETKVSCEKKMNILELHLIDIESKSINNRQTFEEIDDILNNPPKLITMVEANRRIARLEKCIRSQ